jgi:hypothetical protein
MARSWRPSHAVPPRDVSQETSWRTSASSTGGSRHDVDNRLFLRQYLHRSRGTLQLLRQNPRACRGSMVSRRCHGDPPKSTEAKGNGSALVRPTLQVNPDPPRPAETEASDFSSSGHGSIPCRPIGDGCHQTETASRGARTSCGAMNAVLAQRPVRAAPPDAGEADCSAGSS